MIKETEALSLEPRKKPSQKRSLERVNNILNACAALMAEIGPDGVNTNTIAERADIPVSSLYQYFPNKHAVLIELMRQELREIDQVTARVVEKITPKTHWTELCETLVDDYVELTKTQPGFVALWHTIQAHPALYNIQSGDYLINQLVSLQKGIELYFALHAPGKMNETEIGHMKRTAIEAVIPIIGRASQSTGAEKKRLKESARMLLVGYLANFMPE